MKLNQYHKATLLILHTITTQSRKRPPTLHEIYNALRNVPDARSIIIELEESGYVAQVSRGRTKTLSLTAIGSSTVLADWIVSRWDAEVKHRPEENAHRRTLDNTWRQVYRFVAGDELPRPSPSEEPEESQADEGNALGIMLEVASTLLNMEPDAFVTEYAAEGISPESLLDARDAIASLCFVRDPPVVMIVELTHGKTTRARILGCHGEDAAPSIDHPPTEAPV